MDNWIEPFITEMQCEDYYNEDLYNAEYEGTQVYKEYLKAQEWGE